MTWFEKEKNEQGKAKRHQEVSIRGQYKNTLTQPLQPPVQKDEEKSCVIQCPKGHRYSLSEEELDSLGANLKCDECNQTYATMQWKGIQEPNDEEED